MNTNPRDGRHMRFLYMLDAAIAAGCGAHPRRGAGRSGAPAL